MPEGILLLAILLAMGRALHVITIGFDPHHDFYAFAPGLYLLEGLLPHRDFYTHYGSIDALVKAALLGLFGKTVVSLIGAGAGALQLRLIRRRAAMILCLARCTSSSSRIRIRS